MLNYLKNRPATSELLDSYHQEKDNHHYNMTTSTTSINNSTHFNMESKNISPPSPAAIRVMCQPASTVHHESKTTIHSPISSSGSHHDDSDSSFSPSSSNSSSSTHDHHHSHQSSRKNSITSISSISKSSKTKKNNSKKHAKITSSSAHKSKYTPDSKKKSKIKIPVFELIRVMALPQSTAANCLGVSLSTLKRRYYELGIGRWPGQVNVTKDIDLDVPTSEKSKLSYLMNEENLDSAKDLDQVTLSILNFTFKQSF